MNPAASPKDKALLQGDRLPGQEVKVGFGLRGLLLWKSLLRASSLIISVDSGFGELLSTSDVLLGDNVLSLMSSC